MGLSCTKTASHQSEVVWQTIKIRGGAAPRSVLGGKSRTCQHLATPEIKMITVREKDLPETTKFVPQQTLFSGFGGRKAPSSIGKISATGVLRLRATSAVSHDKAVGRSAQDDDFVEALTKNVLNRC